MPFQHTHITCDGCGMIQSAFWNPVQPPSCPRSSRVCRLCGGLLREPGGDSAPPHDDPEPPTTLPPQDSPNPT